MSTDYSELRPIKVVVAILWLVAAATLVATSYLVPRSEEIRMQKATRIKADSAAAPIELRPVSNRVDTEYQQGSR